MLHKCATKDCRNRFKYFGVGLLYVAPRRKKDAPKTNVEELEFFWLCEKCARRENETPLGRLPVIVGPTARRTA
jgi:hypothetical protein